mmetsp:Transcript_21185/g.52094  ORF Transcript_21185/g.52094 Transcript_21185/m.52094 type:complete len:174 (+) Transcript_21185:6989-7510(+)
MQSLPELTKQQLEPISSRLSKNIQSQASWRLSVNLAQILLACQTVERAAKPETLDGMWFKESTDATYRNSQASDPKAHHKPCEEKPFISRTKGSEDSKDADCCCSKCKDSSPSNNIRQGRENQCADCSASKDNRNNGIFLVIRESPLCFQNHREKRQKQNLHGICCETKTCCQ